MSEEVKKEVQSKMEIYDIFDDLVTAPTGAVIIYKMMYVDTHGREKDVYIAVFDDGDYTMPWGVGVDMVDALQAANREFAYWYSSSPEKKRNPFAEILKSLKCTH